VWVEKYLYKTGSDVAGRQSQERQRVLFNSLASSLNNKLDLQVFVRGSTIKQPSNQPCSLDPTRGASGRKTSPRHSTAGGLNAPCVICIVSVAQAKLLEDELLSLGDEVLALGGGAARDLGELLHEVGRLGELGRRGRGRRRLLGGDHEVGHH
jgi:hypothetical protein